MSDNVRVVASGQGTRILCIADARGALRQINALVKKHDADVVIHTGSFGFFDSDSADSMSRDGLAAAANSSPVVNGGNFHEMNEEHLRESVGSQLSELPLFLAGAQKFTVPVYTIWGSSEDVVVVEKFRNGTYSIPHLHLVDELNAPLIPNTSIRLLGLSGLFKKSQLFNIGDGQTVPGTSELMWVGIWQIGELLRTFKETYNQEEVRFFLCSANPLLKPLVNYLALVLRSDITLSGSSQQKRVSSFNDMVMYGKIKHFVRDIKTKKSLMYSFWTHAQPQVLELTKDTPDQRDLILSAINLLTSRDNEVSLQDAIQMLRSKWNFNLCNVSDGEMVLNASSTGITTECTNPNLTFEKGVPEPLTDVLKSSDESTQTNEGPRDEKIIANESHTEAKSDKAKARAEKLSLKKEKARSLKKEKLKAVRSESQEPGAEATTSIREVARNTIPTGPARGGYPETEGSLGSKKDFIKDKYKSKKDKERSMREEDQVISNSGNNRRPGLWFKNGDRSPEEILGFLAEEDRKCNPKVEIRSNVRPNGLKSKVALVFFDTQEQASGAYERVDKDSAGTVSIYQPEQHNPRKYMRKGRKW